MVIESQFYDLNKRVSDNEVKIGSTQTQINSLFSVMQEMKDTQKLVLVALENIRAEIHNIAANSVSKADHALIVKRVTELENSKTWLVAATSTVAAMVAAIWAITTFLAPLLQHGV